MTHTDTILNAEKANRLFWLGRYVERAYLTLHLVRRAYDEMLDTPVGGTPQSPLLTLLRTHTGADFATSRELMAHTYDPRNAASLRAIAERTKDNSMLLRSEICSESLSYVEMTHALIAARATAGDTNITCLQPATDWLLAFWGSVGERVYGQHLTLLCAGRLVEHIDMNLRFRYKPYRIAEAWAELCEHMAEAPALFDTVQAQRIAALVADASYDTDAARRAELLAALGILVLV